MEWNCIGRWQESTLDYKQIKKYNPRKNLFYKKHLRPNNQETHQAFSQIQEQIRLVIENFKKKYENISNKLSNDRVNEKCYWTILKRFFLTVKYSLYTLLLHEDKFTKQCLLLKIESRILPRLLPYTNTCLSTVRFSEKDILKVIQKVIPD